MAPVLQHGVPLAPLEKGEETDATGTTITFWADGEIFETTDYSYETLRTNFQQRAFLNKGLSLNLTDERVHPEDETARARTTPRRGPRATGTTTGSSTTSSTSTR